VAKRDERGTDLSDRIDGRLDNLETGMASLTRGIEKVWAQRRTDREQATLEARTRHKEVMDALREMNGTVRNHGERLVAQETRCVLHHGDALSGEVGEARMPQDSSRIDPQTRLAMQAGGWAGGAVAVLWIAWQIIETVVKAVQSGASP
jgi:hypothetical protein